MTIYRLKTVAKNIVPMNILIRHRNILHYKKSLKKIKLEGYEKYGFLYNGSKSNERLLVVLVIGESLRSDRLGINGYDRDTTPMLSNVSHLFSFKDVLSCSTSTSISIPCMLTDEKIDGWNEKFIHHSYIPKYSVVKIFRDLGFDTKWISSANKDYGIYVNKQFPAAHSLMLADELNHKYLKDSEKFGDLLLPEAINVNIKKDTLYVLGTMGSHRDYRYRYTKNMAHFKPDHGFSSQAMNNAYDNTVRYFDKFMYELIQKIKKQNSIIIYLSDHGESLGEHGRFQHGAAYKTAPKEQKLVPMLVWMSNKFIATHPQKYRNIQHLQDLNHSGTKNITHDFLFYSLVDCVGIESKSTLFKKDFSVC